ncbi:MAG: hypothetical protein JEY94_17860 [Melioribacteraceae bacterium]|nr:hypothetical protein [Melioribacteraceae bacterium]
MNVKSNGFLSLSQTQKFAQRVKFYQINLQIQFGIKKMRSIAFSHGLPGQTFLQFAFSHGLPGQTFLQFAFSHGLPGQTFLQFVFSHELPGRTFLQFVFSHGKKSPKVVFCI